MENSTEPSAVAANQAFQILRFGFTVAPILAGLDKFLHLLVDCQEERCYGFTASIVADIK